ncbi:AraC family transcriptional regulator [Zestomonas carbonaria]|uniref:Arabinose operon regulatory protein n=1 Tax=Zestomonas carbonaria TaxID=2762745 RepID=A0A7U7EK01_9GAMM|nr:AraC family transcriptional regulator [Pseudomonas carbonaria]CAD5106427.1 Arabinose operon regulatory protein [Pseudomonas carbonaria]
MAELRHARLGVLELASAAGPGHRFDKHSHDEFVISANLRGDEQVWLDGRTFEAGAGAITTYNPGQIQGGGVAGDRPWHFVSLYVTPDRLADSLGLDTLEFARPLRHLPALAEALAGAVQAGLQTDPFQRERAEERLTLLLGEVARAAGVRLPGCADAGRGPVQRLQEWLAADLQETPDLDAMATHVGLSKFHLLRSFQQQVGLSPRQWAMQLRTRRAQALLRAGRPATDVAHVLGFADQSHLSRYFRAAYGISPGRFQRALRG